jgi:hypothetical protein
MQSDTWERLPLIMVASARDHATKRRRLVDSAPTVRYGIAGGQSEEMAKGAAYESEGAIRYLE